MTLDDFIKEQQKALKDFKAYWKDMQKEDPEYYPEVLDPGEWDEQLQIFNPVKKDAMA